MTRPPLSRRARFVAVLLGVAAAVLGGAPAWAGSGSGGKITICHRTHSTTNPYRRITVSISAANGSSSNDHTHHQGPVFDATYDYPPNAKIWGDVIPSTLNWTTEGQALYAGASCGVMTAQDFYNVEVEAGQAPADVIADLAEQGADTDTTVDFSSLTYTGTDPDLQPTPSPTPDPTDSATPTPDPTDSASPTPDPTDSASPTPDPTDSATPDPTDSATPDPTDSATPDPTDSATPDPTDSATPDPTESPSPTPDPTQSATPDPVPPVTGHPSPTPADVHVVRHVLVYLDLDGDGAREDVEPGLPDVPVTDGSRTLAATDELGRATLSLRSATGSAVIAPPAGLALVASSAGRSLVVPATADPLWWGLRGTQELELDRAALPGLPLEGHVTVLWAGPDARFGTSDDVRLVLPVHGGRVVASGLPPGRYSLGGGTVTLRPGHTPVVVRAHARHLPFTGLPLFDAARLALTAVVVGALLLLVSRPRRTS